MKCPKCGTELRANARFCSLCGHQLSDSAVSSTPLPDQVPPRLTTPLENTQPSAAGSPRDALAEHPTQVLSEEQPAPIPAQTTDDSARSVVPQAPVTPPDPDDTVPLNNIPTGFAPLPEGALFPQTMPPRYHSVEVRSQSPKLNVYLVQTLQPVRLCFNSDCLLNETDEIYCPNCGAQTSEPTTLRYLLKESSDKTTFASLAQIREMGLNHPGLLLFEQFQETPYGPSPRYYLLEPEPAPTLASSLSAPQELPRVLDWGQQLAEALKYLHQYGLVWRTLTGHHVAIEDKRARWVNFNTDAAKSETDYPQDVQNLTQLLFYLATGALDYTSGHELPEPVARLFEQTLGQQATITTAPELAASLKATLAEVRRPASVRLISSGQTDVGVVRDHNEDSLMTQELTWSNKGISRPLGLYVVADGMGGHSAGEVASGLVISTLARKMTSEIMATQAGEAKVGALEPLTWLQNSISEANTAVFEQAKQTGTDMGTTVVAALLIGDAAYVGHVGDSRAYLLNAEETRQLTVDHSLVERLVATGQISREEAEDHPQRNVIYRTIGDKPRIEVDTTTHRLAPGERLLLCSDGLAGMVSDDNIRRIVFDSVSLPEACRRLINAANTAGGDDNVTVVIVQVEAA